MKFDKKYLPIQDKNEALTLLKRKVTKEMEEELNKHSHLFNSNELMAPRDFNVSVVDYVYIKNYIYQFIIQSKVEDWIILNYMGDKKRDVPLYEWNILLEKEVNALDWLANGGYYIHTVLDSAKLLQGKSELIIELFQEKWIIRYNHKH